MLQTSNQCDWQTINTLLSNLDAEVSEETPTVKPLKWEEDMQLFSRFLDRKVSSLLASHWVLMLYLRLSTSYFEWKGPQALYPKDFHCRIDSS